MTHQKWDPTLHPIVRLEADYNSIIDHGLEKAASFVMRKNGSYFEAIKGGTSTGAGTIAYGGSGDAGGATGSVAADVINAALLAIDTSGSGGLYWKYADYPINAQLTIPSNTWMKCDRGTSITLEDGADCFMLRAAGADAGPTTFTRNVWIEGFEFDGNGSNQASNGQLSLTAIQDWVFVHNYVHDTYSVAIYVQPIGDPETPTVGCDRNYFAYNRIEDQANSADLFIAGMRYSTIAYNYLSGTLGNYLLSGGAHSRGLRLVGNTLRSGGLTGIGLESSQRVYMLENDIEGMTGHGIYAKDTASYANPENLVIKDNIVQNNSGAGIYLANTLHATIDGNHIFDNGDAGVTVYDCRDLMITNNTIYDNNQDGNAAPDNTGIRVGHASDTGTIEGNIIYDGGGATQNYGIYFGAHAAVVLGDNRIYGNVTASIGNINSGSTFISKSRVMSTSLDLSGGASTVPVFHANSAATLLRANLLYTEASSADAGVGIEIGKESDRNYYYNGNSEVSKALWYEHPVDQLAVDIAAGDTVTFYSAGGKVGTGEIALVLDFMSGAE